MSNQIALLNEVKNLYILYPELKSICSDMHACRENSKLGGEPICMLVTGDSGLGKTSLIKYYKMEHSAYEINDGTYMPVLFLELPSNATVKQVASEMLSALGDPAAFRPGSEVERTHAVITLLKEMKVELIIIDEFQHLIQRTDNRVLHNTADWIKSIINQSGIPIVLFGMPWSLEILKYNSQLSRRFSLHRELKHFRISVQKSQRLFRQFLKCVDIAIPLSTTSNLEKKKIALRLFAASRGNHDVIMKLIFQAFQYSLEHSKNKLTIKAFRTAWKKLNLGETNPFKQKLKELEFIEVIKPHRWDWNANKNAGPLAQILYTYQYNEVINPKDK